MGKGGDGKAYISKLTYVDEKKNDRIGDGKGGGGQRGGSKRRNMCSEIGTQLSHRTDGQSIHD